MLRRAQRGELRGEASPDLLQEFLHQRARRTGDRAAAAELTRDVARLCDFHDLTEADARLGIDLFGRHRRLSARDAAFAAFALNRAIGAILSVDRDLDGIEGLTRIDPSDREAVAVLVT